jgi:hypothetical protein
MPTEIPTQVRANAESVCGLDRADVETAIGLEIGRVKGDLATADSEGKRACEIWPTDAQWVDGAMLFVDVMPASSDEAKKRRAEVDGRATGVIEPSVRYDGVDGAAWNGTRGAVSVVFVGEHAVALTTRWNGDDRVAATDALALSQQVASSQGLGQ